MPDFTYETFWHCESAENFQIEVVGSKGDKYVVRFDDLHHKNRYEVTYDWSCTCKAYQYRPDYCKHIKQVIDEGRRCGWQQFIDGGKVVIDDEFNAACPKCGAAAHAMRHAV